MALDAGTTVAIITVGLTAGGQLLKNVLDARKSGTESDAAYRKEMASENRSLREEVTAGRKREATAAHEMIECEKEMQRLRMLVVTTQNRALAAEEAIRRISDRHDRIPPA